MTNVNSTVEQSSWINELTPEAQIITRLLNEAEANERIRAAYDALPEGVKAPKASKWTHTSSLTWDATYNGYSLAARKVEGQWNVFLWNEMADDWNTVLIFPKAGIRGFWKNTCVWLAENLAEVTNPLVGYVPPAEDADDSDVAAAVTSIIAERSADAAVQLAEAEGTPAVDEVASAAVHAMIDSWEDTCPKCGMFGNDKCVTKSGKAVKENGGYHAVRPGHGTK